MTCLNCGKNTTRSGYETSPVHFAKWYPMRFCSKECANEYSQRTKGHFQFKEFYKVEVMNDIEKHNLVVR